MHWLTQGEWRIADVTTNPPSQGASAFEILSVSLACEEIYIKFAHLIAGDDNRCRYFVASQDTSLRKTLANTGVVPIFLISHEVILIEPVSEVNRLKAREVRCRHPFSTTADHSPHYYPYLIMTFTDRAK